MLLPESTVSRSFTRFLLPLTDIMMILFSMFLLMPHLEEHKPSAAPEVTPGWQADQQRQHVEQLQRLQRLEGQPLSERSLVRVVTIDRNSGDLLVPREPKPILLTEQNFLEIVAEDLQRARELQRELFYTLLAPLPDAQGTPARPSRRDRERYERLFQEARKRHPNARISFQIVYPASGE
jgi:hypothetical protein